MNGIRQTPWDKRTFNIDTYEITALNEEVLQSADEIEGHFTVKADPYRDHQLLHDHGFYYVDTLIEPHCSKDDLRLFHSDQFEISTTFDKEKVLHIAAHTFEHGRFHRDYHIPDELADLRYMRWVQDLIAEDNIFGLIYEQQEIGFYGFKEDAVLLLGIDSDFRGKGLTKPFTSLCVKKQFDRGYDRLKTSISAANVKSLNLFIQLGFTLHQTVDVYHKLNGTLKEV